MTYVELLDTLCSTISNLEGCELRAYPDPASMLGIALRKQGLTARYLRGKVSIPDNLLALSGAPWTIGHGETLGIKEGMVWTQDYADSRLRIRVAQFMVGVLQRCPALYLEPQERTLACTSLAYNIGVGAFGASSVSRYTMRNEYMSAANSFLLWNKAGGRVLAGLTIRRRRERAIYLLLGS